MKSIYYLLLLLTLSFGSCEFTPEKTKTEATTAAVTCNGVAKPTTKPTPNGYWSCTDTGWVWFEDIGRKGNKPIPSDSIK